MNKILLLFIAGVFVGAAFFELNKRSKTKWEFIHLLERFVEKEVDDLTLCSLSKDEEQFIGDFKTSA